MSSSRTCCCCTTCIRCRSRNACAPLLADVRPYLGTHGGDVELLGVSEGVAQLRLEGSCSGCPSSTVTLRMAIEEAIYKAAPDVERVEAVDGPPAPVLLQIEDLTCPLPMAGA